MPNMKGNIAWFNGQYVDCTHPVISLNDRGWEYGVGVFDTMLAIDGKLIRPGNHIDRLFRHTDQLLDVCPWLNKEEILDIIYSLLHKNRLTNGKYIVKTQITEGSAKRGLLPDSMDKATIAIRTFPDPVSIDYAPANIIIATQRRNEGAIHCRLKSMSYIENISAMKEAKTKGADDAIMLNNAGNVTCFTTSNLFIFKGDTFYTAPQSDGINDGIIREKLLKDQNIYPVIERSLKPDDLFKADGVFMTNTVMGLRPVQSIDGTPIPIANVKIPKDFHLT